MVRHISDFNDEPLRLSALANAKWKAIVKSVPKHLEVYAFLLSKPGDPFTIADVDLPTQVVSGGLCTVNAEDVLAAGERAARSGLVVAGSVHRHPFGGSWLSGTDKDLLEGMAQELASEMVSPFRVTRKARELLLRVGASSEARAESRQELSPGAYTARNVELEEIVRGARVYCLVWSPGGGYHGAAAYVLYDTITGIPQRDFRYLPGIVIEKVQGRLDFDRSGIRKLAETAVTEQSHSRFAYAEEGEPCCAQHR